MPSILNSDDGVVSGTSGLKSTGGNDGLLNIQSNGSTIVAVTGSGISVTGTVSQTGVSTFAAGTASAPSITFTGDTNTGIFSSGADTVNITTGGSERMRIDSSGNVGIGVTPSAARLQVVGVSGGYVQKLNNVNSTRVWAFGVDKVSTNDGIFVIDDVTAGANRLSIDTSGNVTLQKNISVGNATPTTSGTGITFPATQSASSDANTLDDYEEGTWDPTIVGTSTAGTVSYTIRVGRYTKIGRMVQIQMTVEWSSGTGTGNLRISGLPFTSNTTAENYSISAGVFQNVTLSANNTGYFAIIHNSTQIYADQTPVGGGTAASVPYDSSGFLSVSMCYNV